MAGARETSCFGGAKSAYPDRRQGSERLRLELQSSWQVQHFGHPGGPFDHQRQGRRSNGHLDTKNGMAVNNYLAVKKPKAVKKCAFGREKTALGREKA